MLAVVVVVAAALAVAAAPAAVNAACPDGAQGNSVYAHTATLDAVSRVSWTLDAGNLCLRLELTGVGSAGGWIGLGPSPTGQMTGSGPVTASAVMAGSAVSVTAREATAQASANVLATTKYSISGTGGAQVGNVLAGWFSRQVGTDEFPYKDDGTTTIAWGYRLDQGPSVAAGLLPQHSQRDIACLDVEEGTVTPGECPNDQAASFRRSGTTLVLAAATTLLLLLLTMA